MWLNELLRRVAASDAAVATPRRVTVARCCSDRSSVLTGVAFGLLKALVA